VHHAVQEHAPAHHTASTGSHVHILSSQNEQVAERLANALKQRGFNVHVKKSGGSWSIDTAASKNAGENSSTAQALRKSGYSAGVVSN
jgi:cell division septation protein DedD